MDYGDSIGAWSNPGKPDIRGVLRRNDAFYCTGILTAIGKCLWIGGQAYHQLTFNIAKAADVQIDINARCRVQRAGDA